VLAQAKERGNLLGGYVEDVLNGPCTEAYSVGTIGAVVEELCKAWGRPYKKP
jgi:hypothetical protein